MKWLEAYARDRCPRCGGPLNPPDDELARACPPCRLTVQPAEVELFTD